MSAVKELLKKHDYLVIAQQHGDGCLVTYPDVKLLHPKQKRVTESFVVNRGTEHGLFVHATYLDDSVFVNVPLYAVRIFIQEEMSLCCRQIGLNTSMVEYLDADGQVKESLEEIVDGPETANDLKKEGFLRKIFVEARVDDFNPEYENVAEAHEVAEGYKVLFQHFAKKETSDE
jgi:hypothetical protein